MSDEVVLTETAVGSLGEARVGVANLLEEDGDLTAQLFVSDRDSGPFVVAKGSVFVAGGRDWEVVLIEKTPGAHGSVTVRPS